MRFGIRLKNIYMCKGTVLQGLWRKLAQLNPCHLEDVTSCLTESCWQASYFTYAFQVLHNMSVVV
jgi:hypothetical protein